MYFWLFLGSNSYGTKLQITPIVKIPDYDVKDKHGHVHSRKVKPGIEYHVYGLTNSFLNEALCLYYFCDDL